MYDSGALPEGTNLKIDGSDALLDTTICYFSSESSQREGTTTRGGYAIPTWAEELCERSSPPQAPK